MTPSFSSHLVNDVFGDPGLFVEVRWSKRAFLFDLGDNHALGPTRLLGANDIFISHTHMDHFIGFDALLRVALGRGKTLRLYGPPGLIDNVQGKLHGYTWNLVDGYPLTIVVCEFHSASIRHTIFRATDGFCRHDEPEQPATPRGERRPFTVLEDPMFTVQAVALNHRIPLLCLRPPGAISSTSTNSDSTKPGAARRLLAQGSEAVFVGGTAGRFPIHGHLVLNTIGRTVNSYRRFRDRFATTASRRSPMSSTPADPENEARIVELARDSDIFYCEAPYLDSDADKARERYHLTAKQAGTMARKAGARELIVFHFSPRYTGQGNGWNGKRWKHSGHPNQPRRDRDLRNGVDQGGPCMGEWVKYASYFLPRWNDRQRVDLSGLAGRSFLAAFASTFPAMTGAPFVLIYLNGGSEHLVTCARSRRWFVPGWSTSAA
ncbi:MAG: hypothetical protein U0231_14070 [Nitrospiraceae bacterium]